MKYISLFFIFLLLMLISSCSLNITSSRFNLKPALYNIEGLNSEYNDYNSNAPPQPYGFDTYVIYSTDFASAGNNFDIFYGKINLFFNDIGGAIGTFFESKRVAPFLKNKCNSNNNEFGPILMNNKFYEYGGAYDGNLYHMLAFENLFNSGKISSLDVFLFASDRTEDIADMTNDLNIYFYTEKDGIKKFFGNSGFDEAYPTYDFNNRTMYFSSNRDGSGTFSIYKCANSSGADLDYFLADSYNGSAIQLVSELDSTSDDKCPFVMYNGSIMVFASNRPGGYGGYDIYYSRLDNTNNRWGTPVNMGGLINSGFDEYRPSIYYVKFNTNSGGGFTYSNVMIFSSNRTGGKGGFDLYLALLPYYLY